MTLPTEFELRKFVAPEIIVGSQASLLIGRYLDHFETRKPLIVTDRTVCQFPWCQQILAEIDAHVNAAVIFDDVTSNPRDYEAMAGARLFAAEHCDLIIAIGGGSPMDCAKCIAIVAANGGNILEYVGVDEVSLPGPPLICIPSTAGSSADVSQFAVILDSQNQIKRAIISKMVVPDLALIDPMPLMTMPPFLTACTGMDALTHAIEAYVSNAQSALTDVHALEAIRLIGEFLEPAVASERTPDTMYQLMLGSIQAGLAFSNASLGAIHAMAHSIGGQFDLPHGLCNSILLEHVIALNFDSTPVRYRRIAASLGIRVDRCIAADSLKAALLDRIRNLRGRIGIPTFIKVEELPDGLIDRLVDVAMNDPCMVTNPRLLEHQEVKAVYERILRPENQTRADP